MESQWSSRNTDYLHSSNTFYVVRNYSPSMKIICYILLLSFLGSCSFPEKAFVKQIEAVTPNLASLTPAIANSYEKGIRYYTRNLPNDSLKRNLTELKVESFELLASSPSSMVFIWNKSKHDVLIEYSLFYKSEPQPVNCAYCIKIRKLNDSLWLQKYWSPLVHVY